MGRVCFDRFGPCGEQLLCSIACELLGDYGRLVQSQMFLHGHLGFGRNVGHLFGIQDAQIQLRSCLAVNLEGRDPNTTTLPARFRSKIHSRSPGGNRRKRDRFAFHPIACHPISINRDAFVNFVSSADSTFRMVAGKANSIASPGASITSMSAL